MKVGHSLARIPFNISKRRLIVSGNICTNTTVVSYTCRIYPYMTVLEPQIAMQITFLNYCVGGYKASTSIVKNIQIIRKKGKQKSPGRATSRSRSQPLKSGGREKVTHINVCIANKQMHVKHKEQLLFPKQGV